jgi:hypothetical protein
MFLDDLPHSVLYHLCKYLSFIDIINLSKTCTRLFILIERNNYFWMIKIQNHFGFKLYQRYVNEIFQNKKNSDYVLYNTDKDREIFEKKFRKLSNIASYIWLWNMLNCKDNSDGYLAYKRIIKQKLCLRTNELKMSLTMDELFGCYFNRSQNLTKENICQISSYKLIYFYLIESKRLSCLNLFPIIISCSPSRSKTIFSNYEFDLNSSTGQCVRLFSNINYQELGIKGKFKSILPGIYEIICRIKLDKNDKHLSYYNKHCSQNHEIEKVVECYFYALPDYGIDCECNGKLMNYDWFESNYLLYGNTNWFNQTMGKIKVFQLSNIYFGFQILADYSYRNILFDYIQLNIVE